MQKKEEVHNQGGIEIGLLMNIRRNILHHYNVLTPVLLDRYDVVI